MGIFDFFRKKLVEAESQKENELEPDEKQPLNFEEIENWFIDKKRRIEKKEQEIIKEIETLISQLILELNEENKEIEKVDLKERKVEERVKIIVLENLSNYSGYINALIESLTKLKKENLQEIIKDINKNFIDFKQKSNLSFEKATFLVGKELEKPKESIRNFFERLNNLAEENKEIFENSKGIQTIGQKIQEIKIFENSKKGIMDEIKHIQKKVLREETEEKILEEDIKKIKNSDEYAEWEKSRQEANLRKKEIEKEIFELKNMVDWKTLLNILHTNEKKMAAIKEYEHHFSQILHEGREKEFLEILDETNFKIEGFSHKINEIKKRTKEINDILNRKDKLEGLASQIMGIRADIKSFNAEKEKVLKRIQKIDENIDYIKKIICEEAGKLGISIQS